MKTELVIIGLAAVLAVGCANPGIVQLSPNTYMLAREDHAGIFGNESALKAEVIRDANAFAEKKGKIAIPISAKEHPMGILGDWASFELTFKVVDENDPEARGTNILTSSSMEGGQGWRNLGGKAVIYPAPSVPVFAVPPVVSPQAIESQIDGEFNGWDGETIVKLTNGQIWQQTEYYYYYLYAYMPHVIVDRASGGYKMKVEGIEKAIRVERLK